jgi:hypothetical protein
MPLSQTFEDGTDPCLSTAGLCLAGHSTQHKPVGHADGVELPETFELALSWDTISMDQRGAFNQTAVSRLL